MIIPPFKIAYMFSGRDEEASFDVSISPVELVSDDPVFRSTLVFRVSFSRVDREVCIVLANLRTEIEAQCGRCGKVFSEDIFIREKRCFVPLDGFDEDCPVRIDSVH